MTADLRLPETLPAPAPDTLSILGARCELAWDGFSWSGQGACGLWVRAHDLGDRWRVCVYADRLAVSPMAEGWGGSLEDAEVHAGLRLAGLMDGGRQMLAAYHDGTDVATVHEALIARAASMRGAL